MNVCLYCGGPLTSARVCANSCSDMEKAKVNWANPEVANRPTPQELKQEALLTEIRDLLRKQNDVVDMARIVYRQILDGQDRVEREADIVMKEQAEATERFKQDVCAQSGAEYPVEAGGADKLPVETQSMQTCLACLGTGSHYNKSTGEYERHACEVCRGSKRTVPAKPVRLLVEVRGEHKEQLLRYLPCIAESFRELPQPTLADLVNSFNCGYCVTTGIDNTRSGVRAVLRALGLEVKE